MIDKSKNQSIETLRGLAVLFVAIGHVIGSTPDGGMRIDFPNPLRYIYLLFDYIQLPLFTAVAGWVYAHKPFSAHRNFGSFVGDKVLRLLLPMATVGTLYFFVQYFMPGTNNTGDMSQIWRIYLFPYTLYWYLPSLFLIFVVQWIIDRYNLMNTAAMWVVGCLIALFFRTINDSWFLHSVPNVLSFKGAFGQLPYFFVGVASVRFAPSIYSNAKLKRLMWVVALLGITMIQVVWFYPDYAALTTFFYPISLIPALFLLLSSKRRNSFLIWIGSYAYTIYLFHGFGASGGRILMNMINVDMILPVLLVASALATLGPIVVDEVLSRFKVLRILFLGKR